MDLEGSPPEIPPGFWPSAAEENPPSAKGTSTGEEPGTSERQNRSNGKENGHVRSSLAEKAASLSWASPITVAIERSLYVPATRTRDPSSLLQSDISLQRSRRPRSLLPAPDHRHLTFPEGFLGLRASFERAFYKCNYFTESLSSDLLPLIWSDLTPEDVSCIFGNQRRWAKTLPWRRDTLSPRKTNAYFRFYTFFLLALGTGHPRSDFGTDLSTSFLPEGHPVPVQADLERGIFGPSPSEQGAENLFSSQQASFIPSDGNQAENGKQHARSSDDHGPRDRSVLDLLSTALEEESPPSQPPRSPANETSGTDSLRSYLHSSRWPEAIGRLGLPHFTSGREVTPLDLVHSHPEFTTADHLYLSREVLGWKSPVAQDVRLGSHLLAEFLSSTSDYRSASSQMPFQTLDASAKHRLLRFLAPLSQASSRHLPLLVRMGLPPTVLTVAGLVLGCGEKKNLHALLPSLIGVHYETLLSRTQSEPGRLSPRETDAVLRIMALIGAGFRCFDTLTDLRYWFQWGGQGSLSPLSLIQQSDLGLCSGLLLFLRRSLSVQARFLW